MKCPNCKKPIEKGEKFCEHCGAPLDEQPKKKMEPKVLLPAGIGGLCLIVVLVIVLFVTPKNTTASQLEEKLELGNKYLASAEYDKAEVAFSEALEIDEKSPDAAIGLAEVYNEQEEPEKALTVLKKASENMGSVSEKTIQKNSSDWKGKTQKYEQVYDRTSELFVAQNNTEMARQVESEKQVIYNINVIINAADSGETLKAEATKAPTKEEQSAAKNSQTNQSAQEQDDTQEPDDAQEPNDTQEPDAPDTEEPEPEEDSGILGVGNPDEITPTPDAESEDITPTPDAESEDITPVPDAESEDITPTPDAESEDITPAPDAESEDITPTPDEEFEDITPAPDAESEDITPTPDAESEDITPTPDAESEDIAPVPDTEPADGELTPEVTPTPDLSITPTPDLSITPTPDLSITPTPEVTPTPMIDPETGLPIGDEEVFIVGEDNVPVPQPDSSVPEDAQPGQNQENTPSENTETSSADSADDVIIYDEDNQESAEDTSEPKPGEDNDGDGSTAENGSTDAAGPEAEDKAEGDENNEDTAENAEEQDASADSVLQAYIQEEGLTSSYYAYYDGQSVDSASVSSLSGVVGVHRQDFNGDGTEELLVVSMTGGRMIFDLYKVNGTSVELADSASGVAGGFGSAVDGLSYGGTQECFIRDNGTSVDIGLAAHYYGADAGDGNPQAKTSVAVYNVNTDCTIQLTASATIVNGSTVYAGSDASAAQEGGKDTFMGMLQAAGLSGSWISDSADTLAAMGLADNPYQDMGAVPNPLGGGLAGTESGVQDLVLVSGNMPAGSTSMYMTHMDNTTH